MDIGASPLLSALSARMKHLSARTGVIAENIANADTPGFVARDISAPAANRSTAVMKTSDPRHVKSAAMSSASVRPHLAPDGEASITGNRVSLESQTMKLAETRMDYELAANVYRKSLAMIRLAAGGGR